MHIGAQTDLSFGIANQIPEERSVASVVYSYLTILSNKMQTMRCELRNMPKTCQNGCLFFSNH